MLPNFFIVGTPKSGTTSLFEYLKKHPEVFMCPVKEPNFFSFLDISEQGLYYSEKGIENYNEYLKLFEEAADKKAIGEASVSYLFYKTVPYKIKKSISDAKIIIILRNPVERAFSHYLMDTRLGYTDVPFDEIVKRKSTHPFQKLYFQQYVELGLYYQQIKRYLEVFGEKQIKIFLTEDLKKDIGDVIKSVYSFLQVENIKTPGLETSHNVYRRPKNIFIEKLYQQKLLRRLIKKTIPQQFLSDIKSAMLIKDKKPILAPSIKSYLNNYFLNDLKKTEALIGRDLSIWYEEK